LNFSTSAEYEITFTKIFTVCWKAVYSAEQNRKYICCLHILRRSNEESTTGLALQSVRMWNSRGSGNSNN